jgi:hypothetical protein
LCSIALDSSSGIEVAQVSFRMADRRRSSRYVFAAPNDARARTVHETILESWEDGVAVVTTTLPARPNDQLVLWFGSGSGKPIALDARVLSRSPLVWLGPLQFRLWLSVGPVPVDERHDPFPRLP